MTTTIMASPIWAHKYVCHLSSSTIRKSTLSNCASSSSMRVHLTPLAQWNGLRQLSISISHNSVKFVKKIKCRGKGVFASLFGVGAPEALVIGVVALLVFGPKGLAEVARNLGKTLREFQPTIRELQDVSREFKSTLEREIGLDDVKNPIQRNYSSGATNTNSSPLAVDSPVDSQIKVETNGSIPISKSSSNEVYSKITDDQLHSVSTQQEKQTESIEESLPEPETPSQVEEPAAVVPPPQKIKSDA